MLTIKVAYSFLVFSDREKITAELTYIYINVELQQQNFQRSLRKDHIM